MSEKTQVHYIQLIAYCSFLKRWLSSFTQVSSSVWAVTQGLRCPWLNVWGSGLGRVGSVIHVSCCLYDFRCIWEWDSKESQAAEHPHTASQVRGPPVSIRWWESRGSVLPHYHFAYGPWPKPRWGMPSTLVQSTQIMFFFSFSTPSSSHRSCVLFFLWGMFAFVIGVKKYWGYHTNR